MNEKQIKTLDFIKTYFRTEIKFSFNDGEFTTTQKHGHGKIFKNGNFKYRLKRYGFSSDGEFYQMSTWRK